MAAKKFPAAQAIAPTAPKYNPITGGKTLSTFISIMLGINPLILLNNNAHININNEHIIPFLI